MFSKLLLWLRTLNWFKSSMSANSEYDLRNERISTRLFIIIWIVCILIIIIYIGQISILHTKEVTNPSYDHFQSLSLRYPRTLRCPCKNIAVPYSSFIHLNPQYHQICSSAFITQKWIDHIVSARDIYVSQDFNSIGAPIFLTLASFCRRANKTITIALQAFNSTSLITVEALVKSVFIEQINSIIISFQLSTELTYYQSVNLIKFSIQTNALLPGLFSNIHIRFDDTQTSLIISPRQYENNTCVCSTNSSCIDRLILKNRQINQRNTSSDFQIPGLFTGCYLGEAVRQSSLECFYQASCIATIEEFLQVPVLFNKTMLPLNSSVTSRFNISSTIDQLLAKAMTEKWKEKISHIEYFHQCQVLSCTYSYTSKFNIVYMITIFFGLIGGLTEVLQMLIPRIVKFIRRRLVPPPPPSRMANQPNDAHRSWKERLYRINLFSKPLVGSNEEKIKQQIISTWIFLFLLLISFIALISYHSVIRVTTVHQIDSPTVDQFIRLQTDQSRNPSLSCPCSTIAIPYEKFFHINYTLHPVCSSNFVQKQWINHAPPQQFYSDRYDFRLIHGSLFNALSSFCQASVDHINTGLISFNQTLFITDQALTLETFTAEAKSNFMMFKKSIIRSFAHEIALISDMTRMNGLISTQDTNYGYRFYIINATLSMTIYHYIPHLDVPRPFYGVCQCYPSAQCYIPLAIYTHNMIHPVDVIPSLYLGCLTIEGIRYSTLACLFDQACVDRMSFWLQAPSVKAIDMDKLSHFYVNSTVSEIENELFVDEWNYSISYPNFHQTCRPDHCRYTLNEKNSFWIILTIVISLMDGLIKILQLIVPFLVRSMFFLYRRCSHRVQRGVTSTATASIFSIRSIIQRLRQLNLFHKGNIHSTDEFEIQGEILATRLYLSSFILSLIILTIYSSQIHITKTVVIANPSIEQYSSLYKEHYQTLSCPCENIDIYQESFLTIQPNFHQICQSDFVDNQWITALSMLAATQQLSNRDFRTFADAVFGTMASLCQLSFSLINDKHVDLNRSSFVTNQIIPPDQLFKQGQLLLDLFISTTENTFINSMQTIRDTIHTNGFISFYGSSVSIVPRIVNQTEFKISSQPKFYNTSSRVSCSCYTDQTCVEPAGLYGPPDDTLTYSVWGFFLSCYILEATLQSNLASLYNQTWIDEFRTEIQFHLISSFYPRALNASRNSHFNVNTSINDMMVKMMVESWYTYVNYSAYFEQCHATECKYTYIIKYNVIYIISIIIGLIGGLDTIFHFAIPRVTKLIRRRWFKRYRQGQIHTISDTTNRP